MCTLVSQGANHDTVRSLVSLSLVVRATHPSMRGVPATNYTPSVPLQPAGPRATKRPTCHQFTTRASCVLLLSQLPIAARHVAPASSGLYCATSRSTTLRQVCGCAGTAARSSVSVSCELRGRAGAQAAPPGSSAGPTTAPNSAAAPSP
jgi:hypothetical protein